MIMISCFEVFFFYLRFSLAENCKFGLWSVLLTVLAALGAIPECLLVKGW